MLSLTKKREEPDNPDSYLSLYRPAGMNVSSIFSKRREAAGERYRAN